MVRVPRMVTVRHDQGEFGYGLIEGVRSSGIPTRSWRHFIIGLSGVIGVSFFSLLDAYFVILSLLIFYRTGHVRLPNGEIGLFVVAVSFLFLAHMASALFNGVAAEDLLSRLYLLLILLVVAVWLDRSYSVVDYKLYLSLSSGAMLSTFYMRLNGIDYANPSLVFKGTSEFVYIALLFLSLVLFRGALARCSLAVVFSIYALLSLYYDARVYFGSAVLGLIVVFLFPLIPRSTMIGALRLRRGTIVFLVSTFFVSIMLLGGVEAMQRALFQDDQHNRYEKQRGEFGAIIGARVEVLGTITAIKDRPWIGHGAWAADPKYIAITEYLAKKYGYKRSFEHNDVYRVHSRIPNHSVILGSWMEAGIVAGVSWLVILVLTLRLMVRTYSELHSGRAFDVAVASVLAVVGFLFVWNMLFSSLSNGRRYYIVMVFYFVVLTFRLYTYRSAASE